MATQIFDKDGTFVDPSDNRITIRRVVQREKSDFGDVMLDEDDVYVTQGGVIIQMKMAHFREEFAFLFVDDPLAPEEG